MKVKMWFSAQFAGTAEKETEVSDNCTIGDIYALFPDVMGLEMDDCCGFQILDGELKGNYFHEVE